MIYRGTLKKCKKNILNKNPAIDAYILKKPSFAQPILTHLRVLIHEACPDVVESIKWGMPCFDYHGPLCHIAGFKQHCVFSFWKAALLSDKSLLENAAKEDSMGHFGRITTLKDLPSATKIKKLIKEAMLLNEKGIKLPKKKAAPMEEPEIPDYFMKELKKNKNANQFFKGFSQSAKREYIEWITDAKTESTRLKRMADALSWISEGKKRNWKYEK